MKSQWENTPEFKGIQPKHLRLCLDRLDKWKKCPDLGNVPVADLDKAQELAGKWKTFNGCRRVHPKILMEAQMLFNAWEKHPALKELGVFKLEHAVKLDKAWQASPVLRGKSVQTIESTLKRVEMEKSFGKKLPLTGKPLSPDHALWQAWMALPNANTLKPAMAGKLLAMVRDWKSRSLLYKKTPAELREAFALLARWKKSPAISRYKPQELMGAWSVNEAWARLKLGCTADQLVPAEKIVAAWKKHPVLHGYQPEKLQEAWEMAVEDEREIEFTEALESAMRNLGPSGKKSIEDFMKVLGEPRTSFKTLGWILAGYAHKLCGIKSEQSLYADLVTEYMYKRYGSRANLKKTLATDPVGLAADFSLFLSGGGAALRLSASALRATTRAGLLSGIPAKGAMITARQLDGVARIASTTAAVVDPLAIPVFAGKKVVQALPVSPAAVEVVGKVGLGLNRAKKVVDYLQTARSIDKELREQGVIIDYGAP